MKFEELCDARYSLRKFDSRPVEAEKLQKVLEAGRKAPTAHNLQPQRFFVMQSEEALAKADACTACHFHSPVVIVAAYDPEISWKREEDGKKAGIITPSTKTRLMELEADRADIEKGIARELLAEPEFERDQIIYFLERFRSGDINDEAYRIMLVDTFLNSVYLYDDDHLVLVMNYSGENCKVDLKLVEGAVSGDGCKGSAFAPSSA